MKIYSEIRQSAYNALTANWKPAVLAALIFFGISLLNQGINSTGGFCGISSLTFISVIVQFCVIVPLTYAICVAMLGFYNGYTDAVKNMFDVFKGKYARCMAVSWLTALFTFLWALLFIIPGIIKSYAYAMTPFIAAENPEMGANDCIDASQKMMYGHKWELFVLDLTFIGWWLLCAITFGIALLFVYPYMELAHVEFYKELQAEELKNAAAKVATA